MNDWIVQSTSLPNLHPALVHLPLALVPAAVLFDLACISLRERRWLDRAAAALYLLAALGAGAAWWAGRRAVDAFARIPTEAEIDIARHSDWALYTLWCVVLLAAARLAVAWWQRTEERTSLLPVRVTLLLVSFLLVGAVLRTGDLGGRLVFYHGLGVERSEPAVSARKEADASEADAGGESDTGSAVDRLVRGEDGELRWNPAPRDQGALGAVLRPAEGTDAAAVAWKPPSGEGRRGLALEVSGRAVLVLPGSYDDVRVDAEVDLTGFDGSVGVVHHVAGGGDLGVFRVSTGGRAALAQLADGRASSLEQAPVELSERTVTLGVSAAGRHLKGYIDGESVVHGHADAGPSGACGLLLEGRGTVRVLSVHVVPLHSG